MSETAPTSEIARKVCEDIFDSFYWNLHPKSDDNFACVCPEHESSSGKPKLTHPADIVFFYEDPYLGRRTYLHTDMKSYAKGTITSTKMRSALRSLCMTIECARQSEMWRELYSVPDDISYEVQGLLFVHNHDHGFEANFTDAIEKVSISALPVAPDTVIHFMGPADILRLYSIANDLMRLKYKRELPEDYTFYYPDLFLRHRHGDVWGQPATIELLMSPFFAIKHKAAEKIPEGYLIYYNRQGESVDEFLYFFDWMSRFQLLEHGSTIRVRSCCKTSSSSMLSNFHAAKEKYVKAWGFDIARKNLLDAVTLNSIANMVDTYNPGNVGWKDEEA